LWLLPVVGIPSSELPAVALATSLVVTLCTSMAGAWAHWRCGNLVDPFGRQNLTLMLFAAAGAMLGSSVLPALPPRLSLAVMSAFQAGMAVQLWLPRRSALPRSISVSPTVASPAGLDRASTRAYFASVGCLASVGLAGSFIVPFLVHLRVPQRTAVAQASWLGIGIALAATITYADHGQSGGSPSVDGQFGLVYGPAVCLLVAGSFAAVSAGAAMARRLNPTHLQRAIALALLGSSLFTVVVRLA
jgi:uncharacterized membrane protein YfcA